MQRLLVGTGIMGGAIAGDAIIPTARAVNPLARFFFQDVIVPTAR